MSVLREGGGARGIQGCGADGVLQGPAGELGYVADGSVHGEDAAGKRSIRCGAAIFDLDLDGAELVGAVGHAGGGHGVGDQDRAFDALRFEENLNYLGGDVNSIGDDVGRELGAAKHFADDAGLAVIERAHGIESVGGVAGAGLHGSARGFEDGIGVADADANFAAHGFGNHFEGSGKFGGDGHHAHVTTGGLPEAFEDFERGLDEIFGRMHAAAFVAEEWTFEMNAERASLHGSAVGRVRSLSCFDGVGEAFQGIEGLIERGGDGRGKISRNAVVCEEGVELRQFSGCGSHDIEASATVHVNVDEGGRENGVG